MVNLEKLRGIADQLADEDERALATIVAACADELTALRAKAAAGDALRELVTKSALNGRLSAILKYGWLLLLPAQEQLEILSALESCDMAAVKP